MESGKGNCFRKDILLFLCFLFVFTPIRAQEDIFRYPVTQQTRSTFDAVSANLAERPFIKGNFIQEKYLSRFNRSLISSGNFLIAPEQGIVWETLLPFPSTMVMGRDFLLQSRPDGRMSVINAQGNETFIQMADVLSSVFSGQSQKLLENFEVYFSGNVSDWNMGLLPLDSILISFFTRITMSGDNVMRSIRLFEPNGDSITYTLSNHIYPASLNDHEEAYFSIP